MSKSINIPVATDLIVSGDPRLKAFAQQNNTIPSHIEELNTRIDELENAIGQDTSGPIGRAFAIRAEESGYKKGQEDSIKHIGNLRLKKETL